MMHHDHRELPEYLQREVDQHDTVAQRRQIVAGICASIFVSALILGALGVLAFVADLAEPRGHFATHETPIAP